MARSDPLPRTPHGQWSASRQRRKKGQGGKKRSDASILCRNYNLGLRGVIAHIQILDRTNGKADPRIFNWPSFEAVYVPTAVLRLD